MEKTLNSRFTSFFFRSFHCLQCANGEPPLYLNNKRSPGVQLTPTLHCANHVLHYPRYYRPCQTATGWRSSSGRWSSWAGIGRSASSRQVRGETMVPPSLDVEGNQVEAAGDFVWWRHRWCDLLVDVIDPAIRRRVEDLLQVSEVPGSEQAAVLPPGGVRGETVVPPSLDVEGDQVEAAGDFMWCHHRWGICGASLEEVFTQLGKKRKESSIMCLLCCYSCKKCLAWTQKLTFLGCRLH